MSLEALDTDDQDQSAIINEDAVFENSSVDPGFVFEETQEDNDANDQPEDIPSADEQDEQGTGRAAPEPGEV